MDRVPVAGASYDAFRLPDPRDTIESGDVDGSSCKGVDMIEHDGGPKADAP